MPDQISMPTGHAFRVYRKRGAAWYAKYRDSFVASRRRERPSTPPAY